MSNRELQLVQPSYEILEPHTYSGWRGVLERIERTGRTCYKSEEKIGEGTAGRFVRMVIARGHESVLEHESMSVRFVCDRGVSHELVRHRLAAFSQESTRYCNYSAERFGEHVTFVQTPFWEAGSQEEALWRNAMLMAEATYMSLVAKGAKPEQARSVLPNSLKTEIVVTANMREWRHIFRLRCSKAAHPQMRQLMVPLRDEVVRLCSALFGDLLEKEQS